MKPVFAKILDVEENKAFKTNIVELPYFSTTFHFHEECQMSYLVQSDGKRMIGDSIESFKSDELTFIGANTPHVWHNSEQYFEEPKVNPLAKSITLYFSPEKLENALSSFGNMQKLHQFLQVAKRGMKFYGQTKLKLREFLISMANESDELTRTIYLFEILKVLSHTKEYRLLASSGYTNTYQLKDNDRMDKILKYVFNNFSKEMKLEDVAELINMNKQAFCRYFKNRTQKTFVEFVNEVRIGHACKLIGEGEQQVGSIALDCGFKSLSNFNKFFKEAKGTTPRAYKKMLSVVN